jgi:hypothetical protein
MDGIPRGLFHLDAGELKLDTGVLVADILLNLWNEQTV